MSRLRSVPRHQRLLIAVARSQISESGRDRWSSIAEAMGFGGGATPSRRMRQRHGRATWRAARGESGAWHEARRGRLPGVPGLPVGCRGVVTRALVEHQFKQLRCIDQVGDREAFRERRIGGAQELPRLFRVPPLQL
jgi:hypothetical protein